MIYLICQGENKKYVKVEGNLKKNDFLHIENDIYRIKEIKDAKVIVQKLSGSKNDIKVGMVV